MNSDYGTSLSAWMPQERSNPKPLHAEQRATSYIDLIQKSKMEAVRREFQLNGYESTYSPDENVWSTQPGAHTGVAPAGGGAVYLRQRSWPAPERSPTARLPRPRSHGDTNFATSTPIFDDAPLAPFVPDMGIAGMGPAVDTAGVLEKSSTAVGAGGRHEVSGAAVDAGGRHEVSGAAVSLEQARVLLSLPDSVLYDLLRRMRNKRKNKPPKECRFCKNNGERASFCQSHVLKDEAGRVLCPVLRAFVCRRCGAAGDTAHTIKYCPLTTHEERNLSQGMMRSIRKASGRRRYPPAAPSITSFENYEPTLSGTNDSYLFPLEPVWAALEQKLSLY